MDTSRALLFALPLPALLCLLEKMKKGEKKDLLSCWPQKINFSKVTLQNSFFMLQINKSYLLLPLLRVSIPFSTVPSCATLSNSLHMQ